MSPVSGFVLQSEAMKIYIAGDTIWCQEVKEAINTFEPTHIIVNAGGAQFDKGDPITMDANDVLGVCKFAPTSKVIAVHMDTYNHCLLTRSLLKERLLQNGLGSTVQIPLDGETMFL
jgi:L-ascorbate metabolism protein UlaG (beta-lactamase superfamily)